MVSMRDALRRSEGGGNGDLEGRNRECWSCFSQFGADLQEIASSGSANAVPVLAVCKKWCNF